MSENEMADFIENIGFSKTYPSNPYEHASSLIDPEKQDERNSGDIKFSNLVDKDIQLGIINNDFLMLIYSEELKCINSFLSMAKRDNRLFPVFTKYYNDFRSEIILTKTKNGEERKHQAGLSGYRPELPLSGYGQELQFRDNDPEKELNFFEKLFRRKKS